MTFLWRSKCEHVGNWKYSWKIRAKKATEKDRSSKTQLLVSKSELSVSLRNTMMTFSLIMGLMKRVLILEGKYQMYLREHCSENLKMRCWTNSKLFFFLPSTTNTKEKIKTIQTKCQSSCSWYFMWLFRKAVKKSPTFNLADLEMGGEKREVAREIVIDAIKKMISSSSLVRNADYLLSLMSMELEVQWVRKRVDGNKYNMSYWFQKTNRDIYQSKFGCLY